MAFSSLFTLLDDITAVLDVVDFKGFYFIMQ